MRRIQRIGGEARTAALAVAAASLCVLGGLVATSSSSAPSPSRPKHGSGNLATWLDDAGYRTALVGKYFNGYAKEDPTFVPPGWGDWYGAVAPAQHVYDYELNENGRLVHFGTRAADFKSDVLTEKAIGLIERSEQSPDPFFLEISYTTPHAAGPNPSPQPPRDCPAAPKPPPRFAHAFDDQRLPRPPGFNERDVSDKPAGVRRRPRIGSRERKRLTCRYRCTLEALRGVDENVGQVLDALEGTGQLDDTLVVYTSDNGLFFGEHRIPGGKVRHYEESTRVPLLIRGPGVRAGLTVTDPVINADLAPTLLDAAGVPTDAPLDGRSLLGAAAGVPQPGRDLLLESRHYAGIRTSRYVYVEHGRSGRPGARELYAIERDPYELVNLAGRRRQRATVRYRAARLDLLSDCAGEECSRSVLAPLGRAPTARGSS